MQSEVSLKIGTLVVAAAYLSAGYGELDMWRGLEIPQAKISIMYSYLLPGSRVQSPIRPKVDRREDI